MGTNGRLPQTRTSPGTESSWDTAPLAPGRWAEHPGEGLLFRPMGQLGPEAVWRPPGDTGGVRGSVGRMEGLRGMGKALAWGATHSGSSL